MQNVGVEFKLRIHSCRWNHKDKYFLTKTEDGWTLRSLKARDVKCDKGGNPALQNALISESISYPRDLEDFISDIWASSQKRSREEVQSYFDKLADWISRYEESKPNFNALYL